MKFDVETRKFEIFISWFVFGEIYVALEDFKFLDLRAIFGVIYV